MKLRRPAAQRGVFAVLFALLLVVILAGASLALDVGNLYARYADIKHYADAAALAAAHQLDGTADGIGNAIDAAEERVQANQWGRGQTVNWNDEALTFGTSPDGEWHDADYVLGLTEAEIRRYRFARVDATVLDDEMATVLRIFPYSGAPQGVLQAIVAVAGPVLVQMMPLAVCALSPDRTGQRTVYNMAGTYELVEHGFRRGVSYNLLRLNPDGSSPASFVVNPVDFPGSGGSLDASNFADDVVGPFVCAGSILAPSDDRLYVRQPFPVTLVPRLNSRFGQGAGCVSTAALPDPNVKDFQLASWLNNKSGALPLAQAAEYSASGRLVTVADIDPPSPAGRVKEDYGTLWAYARPVRYSASAPNNAGTAFNRTNFPNLYPVASGGNLASTWTSGVLLPYMSTTASVYEAPAGDPLRYRRVLHVPLLACPVTGDEATVLAIGKFMLTSPANDDPGSPVIAAEFGGLLTGYGSASETRLYK